MIALQQAQGITRIPTGIYKHCQAEPVEAVVTKRKGQKVEIKSIHFL